MAASDNKDVEVKAYQFTKKSIYEAEVAKGLPDRRKTEAQAFIDYLSKRTQLVYERRKEMEGFGLLYVELSKFREQLDELMASYTLGMYQSTISICGTLAERICYDFIDMLEWKVHDQVLDQSIKDHLYEIPFRHLLPLMVGIRTIKQEHVNLLNKVYDIRNRYVHAKKSGDSKSDALWFLTPSARYLRIYSQWIVFMISRMASTFVKRNFVSIARQVIKDLKYSVKIV